MSQDKPSNRARHEDTVDEPLADADQGADFGDITDSSESDPMPPGGSDPSPPDAAGITEDRSDEPEETTNPEHSFDAVRAAAELDASLAGHDGALDAPAGYTEMLESEIQELGTMLAAKESRLKAAEDEIERARARITRDAERQVEQRTRAILLDFLEVIDDLDRALASTRDAAEGSAIAAGVELVHKRFLAKLAAHGITHEPALGERFDPRVHEAVSIVPVADPAQDGVIVSVMREGYAVRGELLRPAGVVVGKHGPT